MQKIAINEIELAQRWGISPKTLQRWRTEGRGPRYFKLSKRVCYPIDQILAFLRLCREVGALQPRGGDGVGAPLRQRRG